MGHKSFKKAVVASAALLCVILAPVVLAGQDITGSWEFKTQFNERQMTATVTFTKNASGAYSGTWKGQRGESTLSDITFENGKLKFVRTGKWQEQEFKMTYEGAFESGKLKGNGSGERGSFEFEATRIVGPEAVLGEWQMTIALPDRQVKAKLIISKKDDGMLAGEWISEIGEHTVSDVNFAGGKLTFTRKSKIQDREFEMKYEGAVEGNQLKGVFRGDLGEIVANGTRSGESKPASNVVGKWELTTTSDRGTRTRILTIKDDMSGTYQMRDSEVPVKDLKVEGNKISFKVEQSTPDREIKMDFTGQIDGTTMKGEFTTERGGCPRCS